jgi:hypothetical protein
VFNRKGRKEHEGTVVHVVQRETFAFFAIFASFAVQKSIAAPSPDR